MQRDLGLCEPASGGLGLTVVVEGPVEIVPHVFYPGKVLQIILGKGKFSPLMKFYF